MDRRKFIEKSVQLCTAAVFGLLPMAGCKETDPCDDLSALTSQEIEERKSYQYVKESPHHAKNCTNCEFWLDPDEGQSCGSCGLFEGPVHLTGYCNSWSMA